MLALLNSEQEPMCENNKNKSKKQPPQVRKRRPVRYLLTRLLVVVGMFALIGNIPLYSKITSPQSREHLAINQPSYLADSIADKDLAALPLPVAVETYAGYETEPVPATDTGKWHLRTIASGESLADILKPFNLLTSTHELLNDPTARKALSQLKSNRKLLVQVSNPVNPLKNKISSWHLPSAILCIMTLLRLACPHPSPDSWLKYSSRM